MAAGHVANRIRHGENRQTEGERNTKQPDADMRKRRGQDRATATSEYEPSRTDELCGEPLRHCHDAGHRSTKTKS